MRGPVVKLQHDTVNPAGGEHQPRAEAWQSKRNPPHIIARCGSEHSLQARSAAVWRRDLHKARSRTQYFADCRVSSRTTASAQATAWPEEIGRCLVTCVKRSPEPRLVAWQCQASVATCAGTGSKLANHLPSSLVTPPGQATNWRRLARIGLPDAPDILASRTRGLIDYGRTRGPTATHARIPVTVPNRSAGTTTSRLRFSLGAR